MTKPQSGRNPSTLKAIYKRPLSVLLKWIAIAGIWIISAATVAALFSSDDSIGPLALISLVADVFGITLGLLGILYYFRADDLHREVEDEARASAKIVARLEVRIEDLHSRMWDTLKQSMAGEAEFRDAREILERVVEELSSPEALAEPEKKELRQDLTFVEKYIDDAEKMRTQAFALSPKPGVISATQEEIDKLAKISVEVRLGSRPESDFVDTLNRLIEGGLRLRELPELCDVLGFTAQFNSDGTIQAVAFSEPNGGTN